MDDEHGNRPDPVSTSNARSAGAGFVAGLITTALCLGALACRSAPAEPRPRTAASLAAPVAPPVSAAAAESSVDLGPPEQQFIVHTAAGAIELRSIASEQKRLLAPHADAALHDPRLDLVWLRDGDRLSVVDLRATAPAPTVIARGLPEENRLSIERGSELTYTDDSCSEESTIVLTWEATPSVEAVLTKAPELRLENPAWLSAELARPTKDVAERRDFGKERVRLPKKLLDCDEAKECGATVALGARGEELVRVQETEADCVQRACLLHDPKTGLYASPDKPTQWDKAERVESGSCGTYLFDRAQTTYLLGKRLCAPDGCKTLDGVALGWLQAGDRVGLPGWFERGE